jgi:hypothetical protein
MNGEKNMKLLENLQKQIESFFSEDMMIYIGIGAGVLFIFLLLYGIYLLIMNYVVVLF